MTTRPSFHIVVVCTNNYIPKGGYGVNSLVQYARHHGYKLTLFETKVPDLHPNFSKNEAALQVLRTSNADFVVNIDADVGIMDLDRPLESLLPDYDHVMYAPSNYWHKFEEGKDRGINAGFIIWKNVPRAQEINQDWLRAARTVCHKEANRQPRQQNVFRKCIEPHLQPGDLTFLDHKLVGVPYSSFIKQKKTDKESWKALGAPNYPYAMK